jgi:hypothetical protein
MTDAAGPADPGHCLSLDVEEAVPSERDALLGSDRGDGVGAAEYPARGGDAAVVLQQQQEALLLPASAAMPSSLLITQRRAVALFCSPPFRFPMGVVWATALGGAMHEPAVPFFYLSLGLSVSQIGQAAGILTGGSLLLAPIYGWIFDKRSAMLALVVAISLCGTGCLMRALATGPASVLASALVMSVDGSFESLVLAYVVRDQPSSATNTGSEQPRRHSGVDAPVRLLHRVSKVETISAYLLQVQVCRILGRGLYPVWNWYVELVLPAFSNEASHATREAEEQGGGG